MINTNVATHSGGSFGFVHISVWPLNVIHDCVSPNLVSPGRKEAKCEFMVPFHILFGP